MYVFLCVFLSLFIFYTVKRKNGQSVKLDVFFFIFNKVCPAFVLFFIPLPQDSYSSQGISQPPTPGNLPVPSPMSPSSASISSFHGDESDSIGSPGWPKTPSSPVSGSGFCFYFFVLNYILMLACLFYSIPFFIIYTLKNYLCNDKETKFCPLY